MPPAALLPPFFADYASAFLRCFSPCCAHCAAFAALYAYFLIRQLYYADTPLCRHALAPFIFAATSFFAAAAAYAAFR